MTCSSENLNKATEGNHSGRGSVGVTAPGKFPFTREKNCKCKCFSSSHQHWNKLFYRFQQIFNILSYTTVGFQHFSVPYLGQVHQKHFLHHNSKRIKYL